MKNNTACDRESFIKKLREMNFTGPIEMAGQKFMLYHGRVISVPIDDVYSIAQFRYLLQEVQQMVSQEEWQH